MKTRTIIILGAVLAVTLTFGQWALVMGGDGFTVGPAHHKVFTYGLPFTIIECAPDLPMRTPPWQVPFRFLGNLALVFVIFFAAACLARRVFANHSAS